MRKVKNKQHQVKKSRQGKHLPNKQSVNSRRGIIYTQEREPEIIPIAQKQNVAEVLLPTVFEPLSDEYKQGVDDTIRNWDKHSMLAHCTLWNLALNHSTNGVAYLFKGRDYFTADFLPFCAFRDDPNVMDYITEKVIQHKNVLEETKFTCIEFYTGRMLFNFYEKQELEHRISVLKKYMD